MHSAHLQSNRRRLVIGALCWMTYMLAYLTRNNYAVAMPYIEAEFLVSKASLGLLSSVFMWVYGLGQLVNGALGDRFSAKRMIGLGLCVAALCNVGFGFANSYWVILICWGLNGWFASMLWGPIVKTITNWNTPAQRGGMMVAISTSSTIGALLSLLLSGALAPRWRWMFFVPAIITFAYLLIHWMRFADAPDKQVTKTQAEPPTEGAAKPRVSFSLLLRKTRLRYIMVACLAQGIVKDGIALWSVSFFKESYGLDIGSVAFMLILIPVMNFVGVLLIGALYKRYPRRLERLTACTFAAGVVLVGGLLLLGRQSLWMAVLLLALSSAVMYGANTLVIGIFPLSFASGGRVSGVTGFLDFCAYMASGITALFSGLLIDSLGWGSVMVMWLLVAVIATVFLIVAERSRLSYAVPEETASPGG